MARGNCERCGKVLTYMNSTEGTGICYICLDKKLELKRQERELRQALNLPPKVEPPKQSPQHDPVEHPSHYTSHPSGIECIEITRHMSFNIGNVIKYLWREGNKGAPLEDLKKARWYLEDEIKRREAEAVKQGALFPEHVVKEEI